MERKEAKKICGSWHSLVRFSLFLALLPWGSPAAAQETADYFKQNCASCHTIGGGKLTGPDLKHISQRRQRDWIVNFIINAKAMMDSGDPQARQLQKEYPGVLMPSFPTMLRDRAEALVALIDKESENPKSEFARAAVVERPLTGADVERGRELFRGTQLLARGGPACISCHTVPGVGALGGGKLGPDLTHVLEKFLDRKKLIAWLSPPATPMMAPIYNFKKHPLEAEEILALVAFLEEAGKKSSGTDVASLNYFLLSLGGTVCGLVAFDYVWRRRFRAVRRVLVHGQSGSTPE